MINNPSPAKKYLRPEAGSLSWQELDESQREAFERILMFLEEAIDILDCQYSSKEHKYEKFRVPPWFDDYRNNRMVLLEGERGTGKTSVMLSLIHNCENENKSHQNHRCKHDCTCEEHRKDNDSESDPHCKEHKINDRLSKIRCRAIWLEPLDMEALPGPTNLLAAVLARIEDAIRFQIQPFMKADNRRDPCGILELCPGYNEALQQLSRLQTDAALAWEGNIAGRGAHLDPDVYAMEVIRAENARLMLNHNLSAALDELAKNIPHICGVTNPIFVLPVDDVDLNPTRCLEVLRLLRMVGVPRLFTLVLGNRYNIEMVLDLKHTGEFMSIAGSTGSQCLNDADRTIIRKRASSTAYNMMRKLLPPAQRVRLKSMQVWDALNYRPLSPESENLPRLHNLLKEVPIELKLLIDNEDNLPKLSNGAYVKTLWDFLFYPVPYPYHDANGSSKEFVQKDLYACIYNARNSLRFPIRHIADWWFFLYELSCSELDNKQKKFIGLLGRLCKSAISEDTSLSLKHREEYRHALTQSKATNEWQMYSGITSIPETGPVEKIVQFTFKNTNNPTQPFTTKSLLLSSGSSYRLYTGESELFERLENRSHLLIVETDQLDREIAKFAKSQSLFSLETASALLLFHDLLALGPQWKISQKKININRPVQLWARSLWDIGSESITIVWPAPAFLSSWGYDIFLSRWNVAMDEFTRISDENRQIFYALTWIDACSAVLLREPLLIGKNLTWEKSNQEVLANRLVKLVEKAKGFDPRTLLINDWLIRLPNLLMPEINGIIKPEVNEVTVIEFENFVTRFKNKPESELIKLWNANWSKVESFRSEIFKVFKEKEMDESLIRRLISEGNKYAETMGIEKENISLSLERLFPLEQKDVNQQQPQ